MHLTFRLSIRLATYCLIILSLCGSFGFVSGAAASQPPKPILWFTPDIRLGEPNTVYPFSMQAEVDGIVFRNPTDIPLFLLSKHSGPVAANHLTITPPPGLSSSIQLINDRMFYLNADGMTWEPTSDSVYWLYYGIASSGYLPNLVIDKRSGPNRPSDIQLPAPQITKLFVIYGPELLEIPLEITHELNPTYEQQIQWELDFQLRLEKQARDLQIYFVVMGIIMIGDIIGLIVAMFGIILGIKDAIQNRQNK